MQLEITTLRRRIRFTWERVNPEPDKPSQPQPEQPVPVGTNYPLQIHGAGFRDYRRPKTH